MNGPNFLPAATSFCSLIVMRSLMTWSSVDLGFRHSLTISLLPRNPISTPCVMPRSMTGIRSGKAVL